MSSVYDNWERLVGAVLDREKLKQIALFESFDSSISADFSSRVSFASSHENVSVEYAILLEDVSSPSILSYRDVRAIEFEELKEATRNIRPGLTLDGGVGHVFKGWIDEHSLTASKPGIGIPVAVKILTRDLQGLGGCAEDDGLNELHYLSQLHHPNLIKLIGYSSKEANMFILVYEFMSKGIHLNLIKLVGNCSEKDNIFMLVYEFMPKESLDKHLFRRGHQTLTWATRIKVALDVARALSFLHDKDKPVIHRNVKSSHVLLDGEFNAKLCNFSLATEMNDVSTRVFDSYGCVEPEYIATCCDVYSFGIVVLELLSGRQSLNKNLANWAKPYLRDKETVLRVMDPKLEGQYSIKEVYKVANVALQCLSRDPEKRPRMAEVLLALK